jgi:hypothetical protein
VILRVESEWIRSIPFSRQIRSVSEFPVDPNGGVADENADRARVDVKALTDGPCRPRDFGEPAQVVTTTGREVARLA